MIRLVGVFVKVTIIWRDHAWVLRHFVGETRFAGRAISISPNTEQP